MRCSTDHRSSVSSIFGAKALWDYADQSARFVFGDAAGNALAGRILDIIRSHGPLTRKEIHDYTNRHLSSEKLSEALSTLWALKLIDRQPIATGGRPAEQWTAK